MQEPAPENEPVLLSTRTVDIGTALVLLALSGIVIFDCTRIGFGWLEGQGPAPGLFPFMVAAGLGLASLYTLVQAMFFPPYDADETFVTLPGFMRILSVLVPLFAYVAAIEYLGIYVASFLFIALFMVFIGRENIFKALLIGLGVPLALFFMFERWFLVPLPKGPLEVMLGLG